MRRRPTGDRGSGTVLVLALCTVLAGFAAVLLGVGLLVVTRHRADAAADLAALAAAGRASSGTAGACSAATATARADGARLVGCRFEGQDVVVRVELRPPGLLASLGPATGTARAGPDLLQGGP